MFYGEYGQADDGLVGNTEEFNEGRDSVVTDSELTYWGFGVVQHIDSAAMELYLNYRNIDAEATLDDDGDIENYSGDIDLVTAGARIKF